MLKILAIHGSPHKGETFKATGEFLNEVKERTEIELTNIFLSEEKLEFCRGCLTCIQYGEEKCPIKDNLKRIFDLMLDSDAVLITTSVYSLQVSALVKNLLDRLAFVFHRPCFFGKFFMSITTQAISGDKAVTEYLGTVMRFWGFNVIPGLRLTTQPGFQTKGQKNEIRKRINQAVRTFIKYNEKPKFLPPKNMDFMIFRFKRSLMNSPNFNEVLPRDVEYFKENGWLNSAYYYKTKINPWKKLTGSLFDAIGRKLAKKT